MKVDEEPVGTEVKLQTSDTSESDQSEYYSSELGSFRVNVSEGKDLISIFSVD